MKKLVLATAVAALSVSAAQAAPTVYGKAFLGLDYVKDGRTQLNSHASRIGVKGQEALTQNIDAVYQLEYRLDIDRMNNNCSSSVKDSCGRNFEARDTYLGLAHKQYGTLVAGRLTSIDSNVNYANVAVGALDKAQVAFDAERANNAVAYFSPNYNGLQVMGMYVLDETKKPDETVNESLGRDAFGIAAKYEPKGQPFKFGSSYIQAGKTKASRISGSYDVNNAVTVGGLYQLTNLSNPAATKKENALTVSGSYKTPTPWTAYGQVDVVKNAGGIDDVNKQRLVLGGKYGFNKAATAHVYAGYTRTDTQGTKTNTHGFGTGLEYKF